MDINSKVKQIFSHCVEENKETKFKKTTFDITEVDIICDFHNSLDFALVYLEKMNFLVGIPPKLSHFLETILTLRF